MKSEDPSGGARAPEEALLRRTLRFLRPVRRTAWIACGVIVLRVLAEVIAVYFLSPAVTAATHFAGADRPARFVDWLRGEASRPLRGILAWMLGSQVFLGITIYLRHIWDTKLSMQAVYHIREAVYDRLQNVNFDFHDRMTSGQLINRALSDLQTVRNFLNMSVLSTFDIVVSVVAYMGLLFLRSPWLMLAALAPLPLWIWIIVRYGRRAQPMYADQQIAADRMMTGLTDNLAGVHVVRAFGTEEQEIRHFESLNAGLLDRMFALVKLQSQLAPLLRAVGSALHIGLFVLTAWLIQRGKVTVGDLMILGTAMGTILGKLQQANAITEAYQKAMVSARRLFEILDAPSPRAGNAASFERGEIEFEGVSFGYDPRQPVLQNINVRVPGRRLTALVGPTGAGKSTLVSLVARFYDPQSGGVRIDGRALNEMDLGELRRNVGYVFQETFLFSDTVRNNIRYGRPDVSDAMVESAARTAHAHEFIATLPRGYDTIIGDKGVQLSGGQRQRLAIARALVYDPRILILDDATAALDPRTERAVHDSVSALFAERTVLVVAHRIETLQRADLILVIENGRIQQSGTHAELMLRDGHYRELAFAQTTEPAASARDATAADGGDWIPLQQPLPALGH